MVITICSLREYARRLRDIPLEAEKGLSLENNEFAKFFGAHPE
jgi:hypothetical protein